MPDRGTIHYLSPASLSIRTVHEGDYDYQDFLVPIHEEEISTTSYMSCIEPEYQRTIAIIKPEAMIYKDVIMRALFFAGFNIMHVSLQKYKLIYIHIE